MSGHRLFNRMRSGLAPMIRPVLEGVAPVRSLGLWLLARRHPSEVELDGQTFRVDPRDFGVTLELHATGTYEPFARGICLDRLKPGMVFLDIGAHVGLYAVPAARAVGPTGRVIAFEPHPGNRALLEQNVQRNGLENVTIVAAAVSDVSGEMDLQVSPFNTGDHRLYRGNPGRSRGILTPVVSIDEWCASEGLQQVDMVKIDVQGAESKVMHGMRGVIESSGDMAIILEYSPWMLRKADATPTDLLERLADAGFALAILDESAAVLEPASPGDIDRACPGRSYVNILATRQSGTA